MTRQIFSYTFSIHRSFILFAKQELITYILLKTFSKIISLLGMIVFLIKVACSAKVLILKILVQKVLILRLPKELILRVLELKVHILRFLISKVKI